MVINDHDRVFMMQCFNSTEIHAVLEGLPKRMRSQIWMSYFKNFDFLRF